MSLDSELGLLHLADFMPHSFLESFFSEVKFKPLLNKQGKDTSNKKDFSVGDLDTQTGKRYRLQVPEYLKFYTHPQCINTFIRDIHPNMMVMVRSRSVPSGDPDDIHEIINSFIQYELEYSDKAKKLRWKIYDPRTWTNQPYYRWWLSQLNYFCLTHNTSQGKRKAEISIDGDVSEPEAGTINPDTVQNLYVVDSVDDQIHIEQILQVLRGAADKARRLREAQGLSRKSSIEMSAEIFVLRLEGEPLSDIAKAFNEDINTVNRWIHDLVRQVTGLLPER